ncbi:peptide deformylase [Candidatus Uhrbacteria bacterium CG10_big_fil_rev_8_21_14_0_10_48_11]|uniref:Peptide deformylase n=1 Tax=Candidatus Uhrbacteria bacterium CG10_big_fil_rev_8_21_14_0_10_48_11 TaxID=1975037 RepID=A0A2M8LEC0_9BACT|nr:MAG: peptide deformylase [Candidatus Uhrbacteria bacterium CG10_big_fil_rev_8_21_14_0_10_48_11]
MATILPLVTLPDERLHQPSEKVSLAGLQQPRIQTLIDDMIATMWKADGVGIAAVQIGKQLRLVIITDGDTPIELINPKILYRSLSKDSMEEGCLSVPGFYGPVRRPRSVYARAYNRHGKKISIKATGFIARIIQHEVDHTNGILFVDRADRVLPNE